MMLKEFMYVTRCFSQNLKNFWCFADIQTRNNIDIGNFRSVSVVPVILKQFKKEIIYQIPLIWKIVWSSSVKKGYCCETVLISLFEGNTFFLDKGLIVCGVLVDLNRPFDSILYKVLVTKFRAYAISYL